MRAIIGLLAITVAAVGVGLVVMRDGGEGQPVLGPVDGHDLPGIELERVAVGMEAPDFSLRALSGDVITLSDYRGNKNVVLVFYRGHW
jgi:hypothetical protein